MYVICTYILNSMYVYIYWQWDHVDLQNRELIKTIKTQKVGVALSAYIARNNVHSKQKHEL